MANFVYNELLRFILRKTEDVGMQGVCGWVSGWVDAWMGRQAGRLVGWLVS